MLITIYTVCYIDVIMKTANRLGSFLKYPFASSRSTHMHSCMHSHYTFTYADDLIKRK